jgi:hypothetical protein
MTSLDIILYSLSQNCFPICGDSKRDFKMTKINFPIAYIKFSISPIPEARPQMLLKNRRGAQLLLIKFRMSFLD